MANDAELRIGGNIDDLKAATDKATAEVRRMADQMQSSMSSLNSMFQKVHGTFMAFTAMLAGGAAFKGVINASNDWALESAKLAKTLGITTEQASVMKVALTHIGVETDVMVAASQKLSKQVFSNADAFGVMGVKVKNASGEYRPVLDIMGETNQKLMAIKNPIEQNIAGMQVYGKSWGEVKGILKLTTEQMDWAAQRAKDLHLIVGPEGADQAKQYKEQMRDLNLVGKSLEVQFGQALTPVFVKLGAWMGEEAPAMGNVFKTVLESIAFVAQSVWLALKDMGDGLGAMAAQAAALLNGDLAGMREIGRLRDEEAAKNEVAYERLKANFGKPIEGRKSKSPEGGGANYNFDQEGGSKGADKSRMSAWEAQLSEAKAYFQKTYDLREYSKEQELEYWRSILTNVKITGQERIAVSKKTAELELEILKKQHQQRVALNGMAIAEKEKSAEDGLKLEELQAQREFDLGNISKEELLALQRQYEDRRFEIAREAQAARITALLGDPNMDPVALQQLLDQMEEIQRAHGLRMAKINADTAVAAKTSWESALSPIGAAFEKTITGMIQGTLTFKKGLSNLLNSILGEFINMCVKMLIKWTATELAKSMSTKENSMLRTLLEKMGLIETTARQDSASTTTVATKGAEADAVVTANAAEAASGAAASVAAIPIAGWAMAAGVFAATMALVLGAKGGIKSASGGFDIPHGVNPVTQLHQDEMVLPAHIANPLRDSLSGGGMAGAGGGLSIQVNAMDSRDVQRALKQGGALHKVLKDYDRRFVIKS